MRATANYWAARPDVQALHDRFKAQMERTSAKVADWRSVAQKGFIQALKAAPAA